MARRGHVNESLLQQRLSKLQIGTEQSLIARLQNFIVNATEKQTAAIPIHLLARVWQVPITSVLKVCLYATRVSVLDLHWTVHCGGCGGMTSSHIHLQEVTHETYCSTCKLTTDNGADKNVQVVFSVNTVICAVPEGSYSVEEPITALEIALVPAFKQLFGTEALSLAESLKVRTLTVLFTDIYDSTAMYERRGDPTAYRIIREHFDVLFAGIFEHHGTIVKTIGDSVMAVFQSPEDAYRAALRLQHTFREFNHRQDVSNDALLKIGIHEGPCLMVNLNNQIDYFGTTVNMAARVQGLAHKEEIVVTASVYEICKNEVHQFYVLKEDARLKGIKEVVPVYRLTPHKKQTGFWFFKR